MGIESYTDRFAFAETALTLMIQNQEICDQCKRTYNIEFHQRTKHYKLFDLERQPHSR